MLARANRVTRPADFRAAVRRGVRVPTGHAVLHVLRGGDGPPRFGFIITKAVGGAVVRNRVRRRLRAVCYHALGRVSDGTDVVIRALPGSEQLSFDMLSSEINEGLGRGAA